MYEGKQVDAIVDVWCEAPVQRLWKEFADSALTEEDRRTKWGGLEYWCASISFGQLDSRRDMNALDRHNAKEYTDDTEREVLEATAHPRCVGWGEMGLDYHYDNSPREIQRDVFARQLRHARILKGIVPKDYRIHIHCLTDTPEFAQCLLSHFPNLYIGITGVITFTTNLNTAQVICQMNPQPSTPSDFQILPETDAPYMVPANIYASLTSLSGNRLPLSHSAMIPWTTDFVSGVLKEKERETDGDGWDSKKVLEVGRENARKVYGM
ncbi:hypothetical protein AAF712_016340 [Marasmius tenuissimus]|uniref:Uncharacterized protein n=1 Tax=Marasmius tenuissimus TaxID=585030 RepID=A0ABR2Z7R9_9AGAR